MFSAYKLNDELYDEVILVVPKGCRAVESGGIVKIQLPSGALTDEVRTLVNDKTGGYVAYVKEPFSPHENRYYFKSDEN